MILQYSSKKICLQDVEATLSAEYDIWLCTCNDTVGTLFTETCVIWHLMYIDKSLQVQKYFVILQLHLHHKCKKKICNPITNFRIMYPFSELHAINYILLCNMQRFHGCIIIEILKILQNILLIFCTIFGT